MPAYKVGSKMASMLTFFKNYSVVIGLCGDETFIINFATHTF